MARRNRNRKTMKGGADTDAAAAPAAPAAPSGSASQTGGRRRRKSMKGGADAPGMSASNAGAVPAPATEQSGGRRRRGKKTRKMSSGADKWRQHMMKVYREMKARNPATKLGDAMRAAKKTYTA